MKSVWYLLQPDFEKYEKIFFHFDEKKKGHIADTHIHTVFKQTGLPREACEKVWMLVNPKGLDVFDRKMFFMALHLLYKCKQGNVLPDEIPQEMIISLDPEGYFQYIT